MRSTIAFWLMMRVSRPVTAVHSAAKTPDCARPATNAKSKAMISPVTNQATSPNLGNLRVLVTEFWFSMFLSCYFPIRLVGKIFSAVRIHDIRRKFLPFPVKSIFPQSINRRPRRVITRVNVFFVRIAPAAVGILVREKIFDGRPHIRLALIVSESAQSVEKLTQNLAIFVMAHGPAKIALQVVVLLRQKPGRETVVFIVVQR